MLAIAKIAQNDQESEIRVSFLVWCSATNMKRGGDSLGLEMTDHIYIRKSFVRAVDRNTINRKDHKISQMEYKT